MIANSSGHTPKPVVLTDELVASLAAAVITTVSSERATWRANLFAPKPNDSCAPMPVTAIRSTPPTESWPQRWAICPFRSPATPTRSRASLPAPP